MLIYIYIISIVFFSRKVSFSCVHFEKRASTFERFARKCTQIFFWKCTINFWSFSCLGFNSKNAIFCRDWALKIQNFLSSLEHTYYVLKFFARAHCARENFWLRARFCTFRASTLKNVRRLLNECTFRARGRVKEKYGGEHRPTRLHVQLRVCGEHRPTRLHVQLSLWRA